MDLFSGVNIGLLVVAFVAVGIILGFAWFAFDSWREKRRKGAIVIAQVLTPLGCSRIPAMLIDYATGDWSGLLHKIRVWADLLTNDPQAVKAEFDKIFHSLLDAQLSSKEGRAYVSSKLALAPADNA